MKKLVATLLSCLMVVAVCMPTMAWAGKSKKKLIVGSGTMASEDRAVPAFSRIEASTMLDLKIAIGGPQTVTIHLDDNLLPFITTRVEDGWLVIENERDWKTELHGHIEISVPALEEIESNGFGDITVTGITSETFTLDHNGAGDVDLTGSVSELVIDLDGMGDIDARDVEAQIASVKVNGMGDVHVHASERLRGQVNGMGDVFSYGKPEHVSVNVSGMGELIEK